MSTDGPTSADAPGPALRISGAIHSTVPCTIIRFVQSRCLFFELADLFSEGGTGIVGDCFPKEDTDVGEEERNAKSLFEEAPSCNFIVSAFVIPIPLATFFFPLNTIFEAPKSLSFARNELVTGSTDTKQLEDFKSK
jgi:hypothetical protein